MKETTSQLLAYSKEFFLSGERELEQNTNLAYMQAVLKFHDAVEYCIRAVIEEHNVNHDRNLDLLPLMKCINQAITTRKLPLASQMDFLNSTRGKIKHHASVPSFEDTQRCRLHAREFLEQVTRDYLNVDFPAVSRLLLVENPTVREYLEMANKKKEEGDYLEALILTKKAFLIARPSDDTFVSRGSFFSGFFLTSGFRDIQGLRQPIERIANKINELEKSVALLMMGVDVLKLHRFEEITPYFSFFLNGECSIVWRNSAEPTQEMVEEAVNYVMDMLLLWQRMGVVGNRPERHGMNGQAAWREVRRESWHPARNNLPTNHSENKSEQN